MVEQGGFNFKTWALARFCHYREAAVADGVDAVYALEYGYKATALAELLTAAGHGEAVAAVVNGEGEYLVESGDLNNAVEALHKKAAGAFYGCQAKALVDGL